MVFAMVVIGGATRLTGSGLSMVEWKPLTGILPPLTEADWMILFEKYRQFPEFLKVNYDMTLEGFKRIFWLEFIHRVWGRAIGLVLLVPTFIIFANSQLRQVYWRPTLLLWSLGIAQGLLGWYMVKSGLVKDPHVSPYRLTTHLLMAAFIIGVSLKMGLALLHNQQLHPLSTQKRQRLLLGLIVLTVCFGGMVAGLKAGYIYNTFPKMDGAWLPENMWFLDPLWKNFFENPGTVQFFHRILATLTFVSLIVFCQSLRQSSGSTKKWSRITLGLVIAQFFLGISTLLLQVPLSLGVLHQGMAFLLLMSLIVLLFHQNSMKRESILHKP